MNKQELQDDWEDLKAILGLGLWIILWVPQILWWCLRNYNNQKKQDEVNFWDYR